jgi:hypothetical protein
MSLERGPLEHDDTATRHNWSAALAMFIAWLARLFEQIAMLKRVRRKPKFNANLRDQILAAGAAQLLAGGELDPSDFSPSTEPPEHSGGPCPAIAFEMNRRVLAIARWHADPEPGIRAHAEGIARGEGVDRDSPVSRRNPPPRSAWRRKTPVRAVSAYPPPARRAGWHAPARDEGGSRSSRGPP